MSFSLQVVWMHGDGAWQQQQEAADHTVHSQEAESEECLCLCSIYFCTFLLCGITLRVNLSTSANLSYTTPDRHAQRLFYMVISSAMKLATMISHHRRKWYEQSSVEQAARL